MKSLKNIINTIYKKFFCGTLITFFAISGIASISSFASISGGGNFYALSWFSFLTTLLLAEVAIKIQKMGKDLTLMEIFQIKF